MMKRLVVSCWLLVTGVVMDMGARAAELPEGFTECEQFAKSVLYMGDPETRDSESGECAVLAGLSRPEAVSEAQKWYNMSNDS